MLTPAFVQVTRLVDVYGSVYYIEKIDHKKKRVYKNTTQVNEIFFADKIIVCLTIKRPFAQMNQKRQILLDKHANIKFKSLPIADELTQ